MFMDSSLLILFTYLILFKWYTHCQQDSSLQSSAIVETQYLTFDMAQYGPDGGVFSSPNFPNYYPRDTILFYRFKASPDYRVRIEIDFFHIRGVTPQCTHDYLDVFLNITDFDLLENTVNDQLLHRYCARNKPPLLISLTNLLVLGFFTEDTQTERGFNGSFQFIPGKSYRANLVRQPCDYIFESSTAKRGEFFSSTYPGTYLPWQFCNYSFIALPGERIRIRFRDLKLFKTPNIQHCAVDLIKLYDDTLDPPELQRFLSTFRQSNLIHDQLLSEQTDRHHITDLCGTYTMPLDVYSTSNRLLFYFIATHYAEFTDAERRQLNDPVGLFWRKGFYAEYEFLSSLTKLDFISQSKSNEYVSGTECDQTVKSFGQGYGRIQSPNWPNLYKPQTSCTTYLLGLDDRYTLENVEIEFEQFDIDCQVASLIIYNASRIYDYRSRTQSSSLSASSRSRSPQKSSFFSDYYQQELDFKNDLTFCGHFKPEGRFVSKNALLKLSFRPNDYLTDKTSPSLTTGGRFEAKYKFVKSYHQVSADEYDGTNSSICHFSYYQSRSQTGKLQPPRSSENDYFSNSNCTFHFHLLDHHSRLLIWFDYFNIADADYVHCPLDNLTYTFRLNSSSIYQLHPFIYCGYRNFPSPYLTSSETKEFRLHFRSNDDSDAGLGFDGRYQFLNQTNPLFSSTCSTPFDPIIDTSKTREYSGNLSSNGYPENIVCEWSYRTAEHFQFHLNLSILQIEGSKTKDPPQGCQSSVLRILSKDRIEELCGTQEIILYILTHSNWFTVQFISLTRQTKEQLSGFNLTWTVVQVSTHRNQSLVEDYFHCQKSSNDMNKTTFSIHQSLLCDGYAHCQPLSNDDELLSNCPYHSPSYSRFRFSSFLSQHYKLMLILFSIFIVLVSLGLVIIFLLSKIQRQTPKDTRSREMKTKSSRNIHLINEDDEQDLSGMSMMEQTVTTV